MIATDSGSVITAFSSEIPEAGKLDIDDPVNNYLGELAIADLSNDGTPVTFRHLMSHHSGIQVPGCGFSR